LAALAALCVGAIVIFTAGALAGFHLTR